MKKPVKENEPSAEKFQINSEKDKKNIHSIPCSFSNIPDENIQIMYSINSDNEEVLA